MGYQFVHYEAYARVAKKARSKGAEGRRSLNAICREADRERGSHPHVENPLQPTSINGLPFDSFLDAAEAIGKAADESRITTQRNGKEVKQKVPKNGSVALGVVASFPTAVEDLTEDGKREVEAWVDDVIEFAKKEFGDNRVQAACLHLDEKFPHVHILVGDVEPTDRFVTPHLGDQARNAAQKGDRSKQGKKIGNDAYKSEMLRFQDSYHTHVAIRHGQTRKGPGRRRLTRPQWRAEQKAAEAAASALKARERAQAEANAIIEAAHESARIEAEAAAQDVIKAQKEAGKWQKLSKAEQIALKTAVTELKAAEAKRNKIKAENAKLEAEAEARRAELDKPVKIGQKVRAFASSFMSPSEQSELEEKQSELDELKEEIKGMKGRFKRAVRSYNTVKSEREDERVATKQLLDEVDKATEEHRLMMLKEMHAISTVKDSAERIASLRDLRQQAEDTRYELQRERSRKHELDNDAAPKPK